MHATFRGRCCTSCFWRLVRSRTDYVYLRASKLALSIGSASPPTHLCSLILKWNKQLSTQIDSCSPNTTHSPQLSPNTVENTLLPVKCFSGSHLLSRLPLFLPKNCLYNDCLSQTLWLDVKFTCLNTWTPAAGAIHKLVKLSGDRTLLKKVVSGVWHWCFTT